MSTQLLLLIVSHRSASESDLGTESVDERLETLLHLLGGARRGPVTTNNSTLPPDLVAGTPNDTLQYLSQLELVARKLKDQLMRQKQVIPQTLKELQIYHQLYRMT